MATNKVKRNPIARRLRVFKMKIVGAKKGKGSYNRAKAKADLELTKRTEI